MYCSQNKNNLPFNLFFKVNTRYFPLLNKIRKKKLHINEELKILNHISSWTIVEWNKLDSRTKNLWRTLSRTFDQGNKISLKSSVQYS